MLLSFNGFTIAEVCSAPTDSSAAGPKTSSPSLTPPHAQHSKTKQKTHGWVMVFLWISDYEPQFTFLPCRAFQGDLPRWSWVHLLALRRADFREAAGGRGSAEHGRVPGGAEPHFPSASTLPAVAAPAQQATSQRPPRDTASTPGASDSSAAPPSRPAVQ